MSEMTLQGDDNRKELRNSGPPHSYWTPQASPPPGSPPGPHVFMGRLPCHLGSNLSLVGAILMLLCPLAPSLWHLGPRLPQPPAQDKSCHARDTSLWGQVGVAGARGRGLTSVEQGRVLAQGPQAVEGAEPPEWGPERGRHAGLVSVLMEPAHHGELQEHQGQGAAAVDLGTHNEDTQWGHMMGPPPRQ